MTVRELATQLKLEVCCGAAGLDKEIKGGYTSDLLSDVMGNAREGNIWVTDRKKIPFPKVRQKAYPS